MDQRVLKENLTRLRQELRDYSTDNGLPGPSGKHAEAAERISSSIPLSHGTGAGSFAKAVECGKLLSLNRLLEIGLPKIDLGSQPVEMALGTADGVFLFAAPFRYPSSDCGFLFGRSLEDATDTTGAATPFDSGGLAGVFKRSDPTETPVGFLRRHELPIPEHRELLREFLELLFDDPRHYIDGVDPTYPGPIGLQGGDYRRWTHEVRVCEELRLNRHLEAVFVAKSRVNDLRIEAFLKRCGQENVYFELYSAPRGGEFEVLKRCCVKYFRTKLTG